MNLFLKGEIMSMAQLKYKRVLLKISGEALAGDKHFGFDFDVVSKVCDVIKKCTDMGVQMGVVIGGGNFWRGVTARATSSAPVPTTWACWPRR